MKPHPTLPAAFEQLGLKHELLKGLQKMNFSEPSDIQRALIPPALEGRDVLGQAKTGTGKTAAFALPILHNIDDAPEIQAVILVPTRELAAQVTAEIRRLAEFTQFVITPVYGGQSVRTQVKALGKRTHIVVATPGRIIDLINRKIISLDHVRFAVLDEVDRMLDIGFIDDIRRLLGLITQPHQTLFVSATISDDIRKLAKKFMNEPLEVNVSHDDLTVDHVEQVICTVDPWDKYRLLKIVLEKEDPKLAIIFTNTKHAARKLAKKLSGDGLNVKEIHGDLVQRKRESVMKRFRRHQIQVLVATDLAARGIDVSDISHIINYDLPEDVEIYVHRIGRTARMGAFGKAISFATREEGDVLTRIEMLINKQIEFFTYEGFTPRPAREQADSAASPQPTILSRTQENVFGAGILQEGQAAPTGPRKTLGSKFKPARRRR